MGSRGKPCHGYPSRSAAVAALDDEGASTREIADRLGLDTKTVAALRPKTKRISRRPTGARARAVPVGQLSPIADVDSDRARRQDAEEGSALLLRAIRRYQGRYEGLAAGPA